jgi:hypothetical protein
MTESAASADVAGPGRVIIRDCASYEDAQRAVDYLADHEFAVQHVQIIGTDLRMVETVTGRMSYGRAAGGGMLSGAWFGLLVGFLIALFTNDDNRFWSLVMTGLLLGAIFGIVFGLVAYALTGGKRDFTSRSQVVAGTYSVTCIQEHAAEARTMLGGVSIR